MKNKTKKILEIIGLAIILAFIFQASSFVLSETLFRRDINALSPTTGAFLGAFFAFFFIRVADMLKEMFERKKRHQRAVVKFQHTASEYFNRIIDNIGVIDDFVAAIETTKDKDIIPICMHKFHHFGLDKNILLDLYNTKLINEIFSFNDSLIRSNNDMDLLMSFSREMRQALAGASISREEYKFNVSNMACKFTDFKKFLIHLDKKTARLVAASRLLLKNRMFWNRCIRLFLKEKFPSEKDIMEEMSVLNKEREQITTESEGENKEIFSKTK
jgi:hypothetical protein